MNSLRIAAVGDISFNGEYEAAIKRTKLPPIFQDVMPALAADLVVGNLETPLTLQPFTGPASRFYMRGNPDYAGLLKAAGFSAVSLANNHIMDLGWAGLEDTMRVLDAEGIVHFGAGKDAQAARKPRTMSIAGLRVALLGYCSVHVAGLPLYATATQPGVAGGHPEHVKIDVASARRENDVVIVFMHWGQELVSMPSPKERRLARIAAEAGADAVIACHPHVLQGMEILGRTLVVYSLGNFVFSDDVFRGVSRAGEAFTMPFRIPEDGRKTGVLRAALRAGAKPEAELVPALLRPELDVVRDPRPLRLKEWEQRCRALQSPVYRLDWLSAMLRARLGAHSRGQESASIWRRLHKLRFRHLRDLLSTLKREWQQLRGAG